MATQRKNATPEPDEPQNETQTEPEAPSLFGLLYSPEVEVTVTSRMVEVTDEHRAAAAAAIATYKKDASAWLKVGPIPTGPITLPDGTVKALDNAALEKFFDDFLTPVKVAGNQAGFVIRKGSTQNPRVLRYHVTGPVKASQAGSKDDSGTETPGAE